MNEIRVFLYTDDPISQAGLASQLAGARGIRIVEAADIDTAEVAVVFADVLDENIAAVVQAVQRNGAPKVVVVAGAVDETGVAIAAACGVAGIVRRREATAERVVCAVRATANGDGFLAPDLLGGLLRRIQETPEAGDSLRGVARPRLNMREQTVLQLISEGCETREIARRMAYSERTVKNVIQDVVQRFGVRNRSHAVAYAVRNGLL